MPKDQKGTGTLQSLLKRKLKILLKYLYESVFLMFRPFTDAAERKMLHIFFFFPLHFTDFFSTC